MSLLNLSYYHLGLGRVEFAVVLVRKAVLARNYFLFDAYPIEDLAYIRVKVLDAPYEIDEQIAIFVNHVIELFVGE
jgi:hypothetical protein